MVAVSGIAAGRSNDRTGREGRLVRFVPPKSQHLQVPARHGLFVECRTCLVDNLNIEGSETCSLRNPWTAEGCFACGVVKIPHHLLCPNRAFTIKYPEICPRPAWAPDDPECRWPQVPSSKPETCLFRTQA